MKSPVESPESVSITLELTSDTATWAEVASYASQIATKVSEMRLQSMNGASTTVGGHFDIAACGVNAIGG